MLKKSILLILLIFGTQVFSQTQKISGKVFDIKTGKTLGFASIKLSGSSLGTVADENGEYIIKLKNGYYDLITSYIGYFTDTSSIAVNDSGFTRNIYLKPTEISTEVIEVMGEDPAYDIIRKAIKYKKEFKKELNEYDYDAYSKFVIKTKGPVSAEYNQKDSVGMSILGILESESTGYFRKPDEEKFIVKTKRETANISKGFAIPLIVNFYEDKIDFGSKKLTGPLSDDAFDTYEYKLTGITSLDSSKVFKIKVINDSKINPQFNGIIYIKDSIFALVKTYLITENEIAPGIYKCEFKQKFSEYKDKKDKLFWMPTDIEINAEGTFAGILKYRGNVFTIVTDYRLNEKAPPGIFNDVIIKVEENAKKDSTYWNKNSVIISKEDEMEAFRNIERETKKNRNKISFGLGNISFGKNFNIGLERIYSFNSISGHTVALTYNYTYKRVSNSLYTGYGFDDNKLKYDFTFNAGLLKDRSLSFVFNAFDILQSPFMDRKLDNEALNTAYTLLSHKERYFYYYLNGYSWNISKRILPQLTAGVGYFQGKRKSAFVSTNYSFVKHDEKYMINPLINDDFRRAILFSAKLDFNKYRAIDYGDGDVSVFQITEYPNLIFKFENSWKDFLGSTYDNRKFVVELRGINDFGPRAKFRYLLGYRHINGEIPYQDLMFFDIFGAYPKMPFAALSYGEFFGDNVYYFNLDYKFGRFLPKRIPILGNIQLQAFFNAGKTTMSDNAYALSPDKNLKTTDGIALETGFAITNILDVVKMHFSWRLNNFGDGKFLFFFTFFDNF